MTKLDELMELNKSVDTIIASAMEDNERVEAEIVATEIEQWSKMWDDIEEWYNKGYIDAAINNINSFLGISYGYYDYEEIARSYKIKIFKRVHSRYPLVYLDVCGGHTEIKRDDDFALINHIYHSKHVTALLLNWGKTKNRIEQKLESLIAENIKRKTKETENTINYNNSLLKALKGEN